MAFMDKLNLKTAVTKSLEFTNIDKKKLSLYFKTNKINRL